MLSDFWIWAILAIAMRLVVMSIGSIWVWAERRVRPPIMKERINSGSDRFFQEEAEREKEIVTGGGSDLDQL
jgi:hypothetical protein